MKDTELLIEVITAGNQARPEIIQLWALDQRSPPEIDPESLYILSTQSPCWRRVDHRTPLRALLFLRIGGNGMAFQRAGVENNHGYYTSLNPDYLDLKQAILDHLLYGNALPAHIKSGQSGRFCDG